VQRESNLSVFQQDATYSVYYIYVGSSQHITPETIHNYISRIHPNFHFNPTYENNNSINFLERVIIRNQFPLPINIYRKPTTRDTTINFLSNHPTEHKTAAYRYLINRMLSLPLTEERRQTEWETIQTIAQNNNFPNTNIARLKAEIQHKAHTRTTKDEHRKWATFTHHSRKVRKLTNFFKHTNINIVFKSTNTIQQSIKPKNPQKIPDYNNSGVYKLTCKTCNMSYIGQTSRDMTQRYREHVRYIRNNDPQSAYAQHILRNQHEYRTITDTMTLLKPIHKTSLLISYEQLFIQTYQYNGTLITEHNRGEQNPLFQLAIDTGLTSQIFHNK